MVSAVFFKEQIKNMSIKNIIQLITELCGQVLFVPGQDSLSLSKP